jgi:hypothetical protein
MCTHPFRRSLMIGAALACAAFCVTPAARGEALGR